MYLHSDGVLEIFERKELVVTILCKTPPDIYLVVQTQAYTRIPLSFT